ncbi:MAG: ECF transporter S component [Clostridia bacterium]|nr:ECF transporter S component [Clostridia bacterium]
MKSSNYIFKINLTAVMVALTCILTMAVRIPSPTKGYLNLGDCAVLFGGWLLGPVWGAIAGGVGSSLADFLSGYPVYIPATMIIKALMALIISLVPYFFNPRKKSHSRVGFLVCSIIAEILMVAGYYLFEAVFIGEGFVPALAGVSGNTVQGTAGIIASYFLVEIFSRTGIIKKVQQTDFERK